MDIKFIGAPIKNIENEVTSMFKQCEKAFIAVSYLKMSGVESIKQSIEENNSTNTKISILTSLDFGITDEEGLRELLDMGVSCNIVHNKNFHPKLYIFELGGGEATMIIGSSNLSHGGLSTNCEANLILNGNISESPIKDAIEYFSHMQSKGILLDEEIINLYGKSKSNVNESENIIDNDNTTIDELNEYLNGRITIKKLSDAEIDVLSDKAENMCVEGYDLYKNGKINESIILYQEACAIFNELMNVDDSHDYLVGKIYCLNGITRAYNNSFKFDVARKSAAEAEKLAETSYNLTDDLDTYFSALFWSIISQNETEKINEKCNRFIELYESSKNYNDNCEIGLVYLESTKHKFELNDIGKASIHRANAIDHLKKDLHNSENHFNCMLAHFNLSDAYKVVGHKEIQNKDTQIKNEKIIDDHNRNALRMAKKIGSQFWEGLSRVEIAKSTNSYKEAFRELKCARKIFVKLGYDEIIKNIDEFDEKYKQGERRYW